MTSVLTEAQKARIRKQKEEAIRKREQKSILQNDSHFFLTGVQEGTCLVKIGSDVSHILSGRPGKVVRIVRNERFLLEAQVRFRDGSVCSGSAISGTDFCEPSLFGAVHHDHQSCTFPSKARDGGEYLETPQRQRTCRMSPLCQRVNSELEEKYEEGDIGGDVVTPPTKKVRTAKEQSVEAEMKLEEPNDVKGNNIQTPPTLKCQLFIEEQPDSLLPKNSNVGRTEPPAYKQTVESELLSGFWNWLHPANRKDSNGLSSQNPHFDPTSILIPKNIFDSMSNFTKQYWEIKSKNFDIILFVKVGKFFELYEADAEIGHNNLGLNFTHGAQRDPSSRRMRCVGIPQSRLDDSISKLVALGYKVGVVLEIESSQMGCKIVSRSLLRIFTPGVITEDNMIGMETRFACCLFPTAFMCDQFVQSDLKCGICFLDASTAQFHLGVAANFVELETQIKKFQPREILFPIQMLSQKVKLRLTSASPTLIWTFLKEGEMDGGFWAPSSVPDRLRPYFENHLDENVNALCKQLHTPEIAGAFGGMASYLRRLKLDRDILPNSQFFLLNSSSLNQLGPMALDAQTLSDLDILEGRDSHFDKRITNSLLNYLDNCKTSFGRRLLRFWICHPLTNPENIEARQVAVEDIKDNSVILNSFGVLSNLPDLERKLFQLQSVGTQITSKTTLFSDDIAVVRRYARDLHSFLSAAEELSRFYFVLRDHKSVLKSSLLKRLISSVPDLGSVVADLRSVFTDESTSSSSTLGIGFRQGLNNSYDTAVVQKEKSDKALEMYLLEQKRKLHCPNLTYFSSGVFFPFLKNAGLMQLTIAKEPRLLQLPKSRPPPANFRLENSTKDFHRYSSPELRELIHQQNSAVRQMDQEEIITVKQICRSFEAQIPLWSAVLSSTAELDVLYSLARASQGADANDVMCRPRLLRRNQCPDDVLDIRGMRHPYLFRDIGQQSVPVDITLGRTATCSLITGPNMGGKSTVLRLGCLAVLLSQLGCYVPAESCILHPVDQIFTRLGAGDDIVRGMSTFEMEMRDISHMLKCATPNSLLAIDELGRGTSTFDGHAIAFAVLHDIVNRVRCRTLFATHYHSLAEDFSTNTQVVPQFMSFRFEGGKGRDGFEDDTGRLVMLFQLQEGTCPRSFGIQCAQTAGIPSALVSRARCLSDTFFGSNLHPSHQHGLFLSSSGPSPPSKRGRGGSMLVDDSERLERRERLQHLARFIAAFQGTHRSEV